MFGNSTNPDLIFRLPKLILDLKSEKRAEPFECLDLLSSFILIYYLT